MIFLNLPINNLLMPKCDICQYQKTKFFHKIDRYVYYQCSRCVTLFLYPKPTLKQISNYYKKSFKYPAGEINEKLIRIRGKSILKNLKKMNPAGKTLLDIGSGYGYFLHEAKVSGFKIAGIEPAKELYSASINRLIEADIQNCSFAEYFMRKQKKKFDFITIIHTIEHVLNPQQTISKALKLLNPQGILYLETPNLDSHLFRSEKQDYTFLTPPDHVWIFSKKSFETILTTIQGIKIEKISSYSYPEHLMGILKKYLNVILGRSDAMTPESINNSGCTPKVIPYQNDKINIKKVKFLLFDKCLAPIFTPLLNVGIYGTILELYIRKK